MGAWIPWRKLATNPPGLDWPALPWQSRGLYSLLLGLADNEGKIALGRLGLTSLAGAIHAPWPELEPFFHQLVLTGWAEERDNCVFLPNFRESQRATSSTDRSIIRRQRLRNEVATTLQQPCNDSLQDRCTTATNRCTEENRIEEIKSEKIDPPITPQGGSEAKVVQPKQKRERRALRSDLVLIATPLLAKLSVARKRLKPSCQMLDPTPANVREIVGRLAEGFTPDQINHVTDVWEILVSTGKRDFADFNPVSPYRRSNIAQYTAMSLDDARRPRFTKGPALPQLPRREEPQDPITRTLFERLQAQKQAERAEHETATSK